MRLFDDFSRRVFAAYTEAFPLLLHVDLFAGSYVATLERTLRVIV